MSYEMFLMIYSNTKKGLIRGLGLCLCFVANIMLQRGLQKRSSCRYDLS